MSLKYPRQLIVIYERGFSGYLCQNERTEKNGNENEPPNYEGMKE